MCTSATPYQLCIIFTRPVLHTRNGRSYVMIVNSSHISRGSCHHPTPNLRQRDPRTTNHAPTTRPMHRPTSVHLATVARTGYHLHSNVPTLLTNVHRLKPHRLKPRTQSSHLLPALSCAASVASGKIRQVLTEVPPGIAETADQQPLAS